MGSTLTSTVARSACACSPVALALWVLVTAAACGDNTTAPALKNAVGSGDFVEIKRLLEVGAGSNATVETTGVNPHASTQIDATLAPLLPARVEPGGIALDEKLGRLYWTEYAADRIRSSDLDGNDTRTVIAEVDGPIGVAIDAARGTIVWTSDASYPRRVSRANLDGGSPTTITEGPPVNRPRAIAFDSTRDEVLWTEAVSGRVLRADDDGTGIGELYTSGISSVADRPDRQAFRSLGLAVSARTGRLFWTELTTSRMQSAARDARGASGELVPRDIATADDGVDFPVGIALDEDAGTIFWTDIGHRAIYRSDLRGGDIRQILGPLDGLVRPYGIVVDGERDRLYWTDAARDVIGRAGSDGTRVEERSLLGDSPFAPRRAPRDCEEATLEAGRRYFADTVASVGACLEKVDAHKAVKRDASDARKAAATCTAGLGRREPLADELRAALTDACRSSASWRREIAAGRNPPAASCAGEKPEPTFDRWLECSLQRHRDGAERVISGRYLRAAEWLSEVRPFIVARTTERTSDSPEMRALDALDALAKSLTEPAATTAASAAVPATGQTTSYRATTAGGSGETLLVPDDGRLRIGVAAAFRDNADGTVTDLRTGLMWEKKCAGCGRLHDSSRDMVWTSDGRQPTIWEWLASVNSEGDTGFAGYTDWRIPNVKELQSILDYERFNPAVGPALDGESCGLGCTALADPRCSCTRMSSYWSSTTCPGQASSAIIVSFNLGLVGTRPKDGFAFVRAVRGTTATAAAIRPD